MESFREHLLVLEMSADYMIKKIRKAVDSAGRNVHKSHLDKNNNYTLDSRKVVNSPYFEKAKKRVRQADNFGKYLDKLNDKGKFDINKHGENLKNIHHDYKEAKRAICDNERYADIRNKRGF